MDITEQLTHESRIALAAAAEITRLRAEVEFLTRQKFEWIKENGPGGWIDNLRKDVEALRADAERHRWLRNVEGALWPYGDSPSSIDCQIDNDRSEDAARAAQGDKT